MHLKTVCLAKMVSDFDPSEIYHAVSEAGDDWADKKSAYEALDDNTRSILADLASNYMASKLSKSESELRALATKDYRDHLAKLQAARKDWLRAQVKYDSLKMLAELRRSQESTRRQEMRLGE